MNLIGRVGAHELTSGVLLSELDHPGPRSGGSGCNETLKQKDTIDQSNMTTARQPPM